MARAREREDARAALELFGQALQCWRGQVVADLSPALRRHPAAVAWSQRRLETAMTYADIAMELGLHEQAVTRLRPLMDIEPLHARLHAQAMLALSGSGQQATALRVFHGLHRLVDELGVEPGERVQAAYLRILRQDRAPVSLPGTPADNRTQRDAGAPVGYRSLPRDIESFTGRTEQTEDLLAMVEAAGAAQGTAALVATVDGMAGVGKTALAIHVAHRLIDRYPDGQLFLDLYAHTDGHQPLSSHLALDRLLRMAGIDGRHIPEGLEERAALWRTVLADRRVMLVLDNAASAAQVEPLLPGGKDCLVLVTSRRRLTSLEGAHTVSLDVLPAGQAMRLFLRVAGRASTSESGAAVEETVRLCGSLPLAIRVAAARLRHRPAWTAAHLAQRLEDEYRGLAELEADEHSVGGAFALSYRHTFSLFTRLLVCVFSGDFMSARPFICQKKLTCRRRCCPVTVVGIGDFSWMSPKTDRE